MPLVAVSKEIRVPDVPSMASGDRLRIPGARSPDVRRQQTRSLPNYRQLSPKPEASNKTGITLQDGTIDRLVKFTRKGATNTNKCDYWHPPFRVFHKRGQCRAGVKCPFIHISNGDRATSPKRTPEGDNVKDSSEIAKPTRQEETLCITPNWIQTFSMQGEGKLHAPRGTSPDFDEVSTEWSEFQEELARNNAWKLHAERAPQDRTCLQGRAQCELLQRDDNDSTKTNTSCTDIFVLLVAVTKQKATPPSDTVPTRHDTASGNFLCQEQQWRRLC